MTVSSASPSNAKDLPTPLPPRPLPNKITNQVSNPLEGVPLQNAKIKLGEDSSESGVVNSDRPTGLLHEHSRSQGTSYSNGVPPALPPRPRKISVVGEEQTHFQADTHARFKSQTQENAPIPNALDPPRETTLNTNTEDYIDPDRDSCPPLSGHSLTSETTVPDQSKITDQYQDYDIIKEDCDKKPSTKTYPSRSRFPNYLILLLLLPIKQIG